MSFRAKGKASFARNLRLQWLFKDVTERFLVVPANASRSSTGICHAKDSNANIPPQWMIYITVEDIDHSVARCLELGGKVIDGPRQMGHSRFCVIQDPAGAVAALIS
jgi:hypothetical protein